VTVVAVVLILGAPVVGWGCTKLLARTPAARDRRARLERESAARRAEEVAFRERYLAELLDTRDDSRRADDDDHWPDPA
jgi:hypothetical protein